jgi:deazaflavin-dependent oxidoreductase (nitroreductase family)
VKSFLGNKRYRAKGKFTPDERSWMLILPATPRGKAFDRLLIRWFGFSLMSYQFAKARRTPYRPQQLLLTTVGSKTGALRTSGLPYFYFDDVLVVCGTKGGGPNDPFWVNNIRKNQQAWIWVKRRQVPVTARVAEGDERAAVFEVVAKQHLGLERYEELSMTHGRPVAMVLLTPRRPLPAGV